MRHKMLCLAAVSLLSSAASAATIVNLDGKANSSIDGSHAVSLNLGAGIYQVTFVEDQYTAFSRWGFEQGCDSFGLHCRQGWENSARIIVGSNEYKFGDANASGGYGPKPGEDAYFATADLSFAHSGIYSLNFSLAAPGTVKFYLYDSARADNRGGVSLSVAAVPEPATWAMLIAGFGLVGATLRRRRLQAA